MKRAVIAIILSAIIVASLAGWWVLKPDKPLVAQLKSDCINMFADDAKFVKALKEQSESGCSSINDTVSRSTCIAWVTHDSSKCPEAQIPTCSPVANRDLLSCPSADALCRALASEDITICSDESLSQGEQEECAAWINRDESFFESTTECSEMAAAQAAVIMRDPSVCKSISDKNQRETCIKSIQGIV